MKINRVAITGVSAMCGLGNNLNEVWTNLIEGKSGISNIPDINPEMVPVQFAGRVKDFQISEEILDKKEWARFDTFIHYALHCSDEAIKSSGLLEAGYSPEMIGSILGTGLGGFPSIEKTQSIYEKTNIRVVGYS